MMMEKFLVTRQCYWLNKAWFNTQDRPNEIMFGVYTVDGGLIGGELRMSWAKTPAEPVETARLIVPEGAWGILASCEDVLKALAEDYEALQAANRTLQPGRFITILEKCGFVDKTPYARHRLRPSFPIR